MTAKTMNCMCGRKHRFYRTEAVCRWPRAAWCVGEGPFVVLAHCGVLTLSLWTSRSAAERAKGRIDALHCGSRCTGRHEVMEIAR